MEDHGDQPKLNARQTRWLVILNEFEFEIKYIKGNENKVVEHSTEGFK